MHIGAFLFMLHPAKLDELFPFLGHEPGRFLGTIPEEGEDVLFDVHVIGEPFGQSTRIVEPAENGSFARLNRHLNLKFNSLHVQGMGP